MIHVKSEKEIDLIRESCKIVRDTLDFVGSKIQAGMSTKEIDELVEKKFEGSLPAFIAAFTKRKRLTEGEIQAIREMIDSIGED